MDVSSKHDVWGRRIALALYVALLIFLDAQSDRGNEHGNSSDHAGDDNEPYYYRGSIVFFFLRMWVSLWHWLHGHGNAEALLAVFTILLMFVTAGLWFHTRRIAIDAGESGRIAALAAEKSAQASLLTIRPWLSVKVRIMEPLAFNEAGDPIFRLRFSVRNVGNTPAMSVTLNQEMRLSAPGIQHSILRLQTLAALMQGLGVQKPSKDRTFSDVEAATAQGSLVNPVGRVLFPGEVFTQYFQIPIPKKWILDSSKDMKDEVFFWPELLVLVSYVYNMAESHATTGLVFNISKSRLMPFKLGETVPVDDIEVALHDMWGGFAT